MRKSFSHLLGIAALLSAVFLFATPTADAEPATLDVPITENIEAVEAAPVASEVDTLCDEAPLFHVAQARAVPILAGCTKRLAGSGAGADCSCNASGATASCSCSGQGTSKVCTCSDATGTTYCYFSNSGSDCECGPTAP